MNTYSDPNMIVCQCPHCSFVISPDLLVQLQFIKVCPNCGKENIVDFYETTLKDGIKKQKENPVWWAHNLN